MKAILFFFVIFFSCNINAATLSAALTLNGLQWANILDTEDLYIPSVYNACGNSGGVCSGTVEGVELTGWRWASQSEVNILVNDFFNVTYNPPTAVNVDTSAWFDHFDITGAEASSKFTIGLSSDSVSYTDENGLLFSGSPSSTLVSFNNDTGQGYIDDYLPFYNIGDYYSFDSPFYTYGFFMVKGEHTPPSAVPLPASLFLFAPALLGLIGFRWKLSARNLLAQH